VKLGILGGTFNPIHLGHLRVAEEIAEDLALEKVYLIPSGIPPHKNSRPLAEFSHRLKMARLASTLSPLLDVWDIEGKRPGISYSIETLGQFHAHFGSQLKLFFIIGIDAFKEITTWKEYQNLFEYTTFVVIGRPGYNAEKFSDFLASVDARFEWNACRNCYCHPSGNILIMRDTTLMDISATQIRERIAKKKSIRFLVPEIVREYIEKTGLYVINEST
jgi:nicotinate-nucleotide adenylyltransferase